MRLQNKTFSLLLLACFFISEAKSQHIIKSKVPVKSVSFKVVEAGFKNIPDTIQTSCYWYWLSDNISEAGVVKDLESMKKVGINRAFIGNIGLGDVPSGKVKFMSAEWWDILHAALKTAARLNIQIGMFNGPGWSQSGGPWVKPRQTMRYLTSSEVMVKGPMVFNKQLFKPQTNFQDVKVLAYPVPADYYSDISSLKPVLSSTPAVDSLATLLDDDQSTGIRFTKGQSFSLDVNTQAAYTVRSMSVSVIHKAVYMEGDIQAKINNQYTTIKHFVIDRRRPSNQFGFIPWAPSVISVPATTSSSYRIIFNNISNNSGITDLKLSSTDRVESYAEKTLAKGWQSEELVWGVYLWDQHPAGHPGPVIDPKQVLDVSNYMAADGTLNWKVPAGNWIIERAGMVPTNMHDGPATPEETGLETDKMSKAHIKAHFDNFIGQVLKRIPAEDRKTFKVVVADSYETGSQNWTDLLISEFKEKYNYDPTPFIPVLQGKVIGSADKSNRFLWDLRRLIADDVAFNYAGGLREVSHKHGLTTWLEPYGYFAFPAEFLQYGGQADEVAGEFWGEGRLGMYENRAAASAAHIYGKTKVSAESFTSAGNEWRAYPGILKPRGDRFFTDGINNTLLHVFISQKDSSSAPGLSAWFGTEFNRENTWFYDADGFIKYLKRANFMLQQGIYAADAAYFIGEDAPKLIGSTDPELPRGYSFDYINGDVIKSRLSVKNGKLTLPNGVNYSILVLPKQQTIRPELLAKIKELVQNGAVVLGPKPEHSPSLQGYPLADKQAKLIADELWGDIDGLKIKIHHFGKGMVLSGMNMQQAFNLLKVIPDYQTDSKDETLFIHRQLQDGSVYFISNQKNETINITASFRVTGKKPELWDPVSGTVRDLPSFKQTGSETRIPLTFAPNESAFIVFRDRAVQSDPAKPNYPIANHSIEINTPWTVRFDHGFRGPVQAVTFTTLTDWSVNANDSIKHYSGPAYYHNVFKIDKILEGTKYIIDLGLVKDVAKISVNGIETGGVWTSPFQLDITKAIKAGDNQLDIKVVNTWVNRLLGDALIPVEKRETHPLVGPDPKLGLESSGILGPVKINVYK